MLKEVFGMPDKPKKDPINLESLEITTTSGTRIIMNNHPQITDQEPGYWLKVIEYTDKERNDVYRRHVIYTQNDVLDIEFRLDGENVVEIK